MDFGAFCELEPRSLQLYFIQVNLSWTKKNISAKKMFKVGDEIECVITEIDKDKRRVAISHRLTQDNPFELLKLNILLEQLLKVKLLIKMNTHYLLKLKI